MSDETLPMNVSETLRAGIHAEINHLIEVMMNMDKEHVISDRDNIEESIEYLEDFGTACTTKVVRRKLAELDILISKLPDRAS